MKALISSYMKSNLSNVYLFDRYWMTFIEEYFYIQNHLQHWRKFA